MLTVGECVGVWIPWIGSWIPLSIGETRAVIGLDTLDRVKRAHTCANVTQLAHMHERARAHEQTPYPPYPSYPSVDLIEEILDRVMDTPGFTLSKRRQR